VNPYQPPQPRPPQEAPTQPFPSAGLLRLVYGLGGGLIAAPYCLLRGVDFCEGDSTSTASDAMIWLGAVALCLIFPPLIFRLTGPKAGPGRIGAGMLSAFSCALLLILGDHLLFGQFGQNSVEALQVALILSAMVSVLALVPGLLMELIGRFGESAPLPPS
jgi:hypothetical protein